MAKKSKKQAKEPLSLSEDTFRLNVLDRVNELKMTMAKFAEDVGELTESWASMFLGGTRAVPMRRMDKIAEVVGRTVPQLFAARPKTGEKGADPVVTSHIDEEKLRGESTPTDVAPPSRLQPQFIDALSAHVDLLESDIKHTSDDVHKLRSALQILRGAKWVHAELDPAKAGGDTTGQPGQSGAAGDSDRNVLPDGRERKTGSSGG